MAKLGAILAGVMGVLIVGGTVVNLKHQNLKSFLEDFRHAVIRFEEDKQLVDSKLKKLKALPSIAENSRFKSAYDKEKQGISGFNELRSACWRIYGDIFFNRNKDIFKDFQSYCAWTNKDKIGEENWASSGANWSNRISKIKQTALSKELKNMTSADDLKRWCSNIEGLVFEGENDSVFKDAKTFCGKND